MASKQNVKVSEDHLIDDENDDLCYDFFYQNNIQLNLLENKELFYGTVCNKIQLNLLENKIQITSIIHDIKISIRPRS